MSTKRFKSRMMSWANKELCGGSYKKFKTPMAINKEIIRRVEAGLKPFGSIVVWSTSRYADVRLEEAWIKREHARLRKNKKLIVSKLRPGEVEGTLRFEVAQKGNLGELFDFEALADEYHLSGLPFIANQILGVCPWKPIDFSRKKLSDFFDCYDIFEKNPKSKIMTEPWLTGLILGYPISDTMSLFYDTKFKK